LPASGLRQQRCEITRRKVLQTSRFAPSFHAKSLGPEARPVRLLGPAHYFLEFVVHAQDAQPTARSAKTAITALFEGKMGNLTMNLSSSDLAFDTTVRAFA